MVSLRVAHEFHDFSLNFVLFSRPLLFQAIEDIPCNPNLGESIPYATVLHFLFSKAPPQMLSPHTVSMVCCFFNETPVKNPAISLSFLVIPCGKRRGVEKQSLLSSYSMVNFLVWFSIRFLSSIDFQVKKIYFLHFQFLSFFLSNTFTSFFSVSCRLLAGPSLNIPNGWTITLVSKNVLHWSGWLTVVSPFPRLLFRLK